MSNAPGVKNPVVAQEAHLREYWKVVWQGRYTVLAVFLLAVTATAVYTFLQTPIYRATATVEVQPQPTRLAPGQDVSGLGVAGYGWWAEEKYHNTQIEIIKSRDIAKRAFQTLGLAHNPAFAGASDPEELFRRRVQVDPRRETGLIEISIMGQDPTEITQWVNVVARAYVERNIEKAQDNVRIAVEAIRSQIDPLQKDLQQAERDRRDLLQLKNVFDPEGTEEILRQKLIEYNKALTAARFEAASLDNILRKIRELLADGADPITMPELQEDPTLLELNRQKVALEREIESTRVTLRPNHPKYEEKRGELAKIEQKISEQVQRVLAGLNNRLILARNNEQDLLVRIKEAERVSMRVGEATAEIDIASTDAETKKRVYDMITKSLNEVQLAAHLLSNNVSLLDPAKVPLHPVKPRKRVNLAVGAFFGMFLGIAVVFFLDYLDNTFRTPQDIEKYLDLSVLGVIPKFAEQETSSRAVKEAYQSLRTSVIFSSKNRQRKVVLVTSTGPQEGKSNAVAHLGRVLASAGDRVIVVDCDLRRPTQHVHLDLAREHGLTNYLAAPEGEDDWTGYVKGTKVPGLHAMVCGPIPPSPPELLGSERFKALLAALKERYDWVLIDSPPAASLADSSLLASMADMVMLVVRHNQTDRDLVARTVQQIRALNAPLVGAVLNNVDIGRAFHKDYYYAGYYYYAEDREKKRRSGRGDSKVKRAG